MTDAEIIQSAYADALTRLFEVYLDALIESHGNPDADATAAAHFGEGIALTRKARDAALQLVQ